MPTVDNRGTDVKTWPDVARRSLMTRGFAVVNDVDVADDRALLRLASEFGPPSTVGNGFPARAIAEVMPRTQRSEVSLGSQRSGHFAMHTDSTGYPRPHDVVILACVRPDESGGGQTLLLPLSDLLALAGPELVDSLAVQLFKFRAAVGRNELWLSSPVLEPRGDNYRVRYRCDQMAPSPSSSAARALTQWQQHVAQAVPGMLLLEAGQALVVDNTRILHGRSGFTASTRRHLRRLKLYTNPAREGPEGPASLW